MLKAGIIWITGIPAAGKTSLAQALCIRIRWQGGLCEVIDGDDIRAVMAPQAGWSPEDRAFQVGRIMYVARALARNGTWAVVAAVSPYAEHRERARGMAQAEGLHFFEVHVSCPLDVAEARDQKGLYARARAGEIGQVTGLDAPYEPPANPDAMIDTTCISPYDGAEKVTDAVLKRMDLNPPVVLLGKGGCGTRMLSSLAQDLGIWLGTGPNVSDSQDSLEWVDLIYRLLHEAGCNHEFPSGSRYRDEIREYAFYILKRNGVPLGRPWGWKLPETMFLLPIFLDAFPGAKIVHLVQHPVSASIRRSHITSEPEHPIGRETLPAAYRHIERDPQTIGFDEVWKRNAIAYNHQVSRVAYYTRSMLPKARCLELRFEDVCENPDMELAKMATFLKMPQARTKASVRVDPARISTWEPGDPRVEEIWKICGNVGELLGYTRGDGEVKVQ